MAIIIYSKRDIEAFLDLRALMEDESYERSVVWYRLMQRIAKKESKMPFCYTIAGQIYCDTESPAMFTMIILEEIRSMPEHLQDAFRQRQNKSTELPLW